MTGEGGRDSVGPGVGYAVSPDPNSITDALVDFFEHDRGEMFCCNLLIEKEKYSWKTLSNVIINLK